MFNIKAKSVFKSIYLLTAILFFCVSQIVAMEFTPDFSTDFSPDLKVDWKSRFDELNKFSIGGILLALQHFEANYLEEKLIEQINFIRANEDALSRNKHIILWAKQYDEKNKPLFGLILDLPDGLLSSIFLDADVKASIRFAAKIYLCKKFEEMLFYDVGTPDYNKFLNIFSGDFYLRQLAALPERSGQTYAMRIDNAARLFILMCELFEEKCVKNAVLSSVSAEKITEIFYEKLDFVDLRSVAVLVSLSKLHAEEQRCVVQ